MSLSGLLSPLSDDPALTRALALPPGPPGPPGSLHGADLVGPPALRPVLAAALTGAGLAGAPADGQPDGQAAGGQAAGRFVLAVTATAREAEDLVAHLGDLVDPDRVAYYPSWETLPHERLSPRSDTVGRRLAVLRRLRHPGSDASNGPLSVVVAPLLFRVRL